jgi:hypothetical protein
MNWQPLSKLDDWSPNQPFICHDYPLWVFVSGQIVLLHAVCIASTPLTFIWLGNTLVIGYLPHISSHTWLWLGIALVISYLLQVLHTSRAYLQLGIAHVCRASLPSLSPSVDPTNCCCRGHHCLPMTPLLSTLCVVVLVLVTFHQHLS